MSNTLTKGVARSLQDRNLRAGWAELQFMARATAHGLTASVPWGHCHRYDIVVEHRGKFSRVQVKSTSHRNGRDFHCRCAPSTRHGAYQHTEIEYLAAYIVPEDVWYIIPVRAISTKKGTILLDPYKCGQKYASFLEAWHLLRHR